MARLKIGEPTVSVANVEKVAVPTPMPIIQSESFKPFLTNETEPEPKVIEKIVEVVVEKQLPAEIIYETLTVEVPVEVVKEVVVEKIVEVPVYVEVIRDVLSYDNIRIDELEKELSNVIELKQRVEKSNKSLKIAIVLTYAVAIMGVILI